MNWDNHNGPLHYDGEIPIYMDQPPSPGDTARLTKDDREFDVRINTIEGDMLTGTVNSIGPEPALHAAGIARDTEVQFATHNILRLSRRDV